MRDIKSILCPVDLSDASRHAIEHAVLLARWYGARITALHVTSPLLVPTADFAIVNQGSLQLPSEEETDDLVRRMRGWFGPASDVTTEFSVDTGNPANRILARAESTPVDLIVMGTHGLGGFQHLVLGSVTEKVLRRAMCPVLTVPPRVHATSRLPFKRLLCPVDFSASSTAALQFALSLAQEGQASLIVLHVFEWSPDGEPLTNRPINVPEYRTELERDLTAKLEGSIPESVKDWCRPELRLVHGKPYREILGAAVEQEADLIVMGVQGRNALDLMLFGSTTNQVVRQAMCPVLTVRATRRM